MSTRESSGNPNAGEAGHQGQDRQPVKETKSAVRNPDPGEAASPSQVEARSKEAGEMQKKAAATTDFNYPGPDRLEAEKSKGNAHHNQREKEPDMQKKVEKL
jgi:hypothetical protein